SQTLEQHHDPGHGLLRLRGHPARRGESAAGEGVAAAAPVRPHARTRFPLPGSPGPAGRSRAPARPGRSRGRGMSAKDSASILVVDDEDHNRALLRAMLGGQHRVLEAANGPAALEVLVAEQVDLVLLDVMMPGMSGYDVCEKIKQRTGEAFLPVLLVTALSEQEQKNLGLQAGADDFLTKPVDRRELLLRVRAFLRLRSQDTLIRLQLKQLAQLQNTKDEMLSLMVHDLRSPLAGIVSHLGLIIEDAPEGHLREDAQAALRSAD